MKSLFKFSRLTAIGGIIIFILIKLAALFMPGVMSELQKDIIGIAENMYEIGLIGVFISCGSVINGQRKKKQLWKQLAESYECEIDELSKIAEQYASDCDLVQYKLDEQVNITKKVNGYRERALVERDTARKLVEVLKTNSAEWLKRYREEKGKVEALENQLRQAELAFDINDMKLNSHINQLEAERQASGRERSMLKQSVNLLQNTLKNFTNACTVKGIGK